MHVHVKNGKRGETEASEGKVLSEKGERNRRAAASQAGKKKRV